MKKYLISLIILLVTSSQTFASTSWKIDDAPSFYLQINSSSGQVDADSLPSYRIYEAAVDTPLLTGSVAKLDDTNTTGFYQVTPTLSAANGFEKGKSYTIRLCSVISTITHCVDETFQIEAEVDANTISGTVATCTNVTNPVLVSDGTGAGQIALTNGNIDVCTALTTNNDKTNYTLSRPTGTIVSDAGNTASTFKTDLSETGTDDWVGSWITFTSGNLNKLTRKISAYNGTTKFITVSPAFSAAPTGTPTFKLINE